MQQKATGIAGGGHEGKPTQGQTKPQRASKVLLLHSQPPRSGSPGTVPVRITMRFGASCLEQDAVRGAW